MKAESKGKAQNAKHRMHKTAVDPHLATSVPLCSGTQSSRTELVSAKLLRNVPWVGFGLTVTGVACPHPSPTSLRLPLWVRGHSRFLFLQSTLGSCQFFGCLLHCILPSCQHLIAILLTAHLFLAPIPCLHHPGRLANPCHFILFKRAIKLMVVSTNCSEGGPLGIYPCTSEVQSVTQGTKERFAKNCVARSDFPFFFVRESSPVHICSHRSGRKKCSGASAYSW